MPSSLDQIAEVNKTIAKHEARLERLEELFSLQERLEQLEKHILRLSEEGGHILETSDPKIK